MRALPTPSNIGHSSRTGGRSNWTGLGFADCVYWIRSLAKTSQRTLPTMLFLCVQQCLLFGGLFPRVRYLVRLPLIHNFLPALSIDILTHWCLASEGVLKGLFPPLNMRPRGYLRLLISGEAVTLTRTVELYNRPCVCYLILQASDVCNSSPGFAFKVIANQSSQTATFVEN